MSLDIRVDSVLCGGTSECVRSMPELFALNDQGRAEVIGEPDAYERGALLAAAWACPTSAIQVLEDGIELDPDPG